ncbi:DUF6602 domain-containing protein [Iodobacter fluviatilis]|uniref:DUF6602 domain-containing protein n=1 Tax=Iodobacter fluviatilis TaxID=537 RepID=A0A377ST22_9NEIS|nr:DUF6602 domain-containing protein [Iodobacter fluviatilis]TCU81326.1 hypothetical protein EV682_12339 [Iodobacter fluviatilis]STR45182.1 Uncharacterised protein [Iodobacter fluviatilis]
MKEHSISQIFKRTLCDFKKALESSTGRPDEIGAPREQQVRNFLKLILPEKIGVSKGYIINQGGDISKECDIVLFNKETCPRFILNEENDLRLFPIEEVYGVIEVKSTLNPTELNDALSKLSSIDTIYKNRFNHIANDLDISCSHDIQTKPFKTIFSYKQGKEWNDFEFNCRLHSYDHPDAIFILNEAAYIHANDDTLARQNSFLKKISFKESTQDDQVWNQIMHRFTRGDSLRYYDDFLIYEAEDSILLLMMYTFILDSIKKINLPDYYSGDYIIFWAEQSDITFDSNGLISKNK